MVIVLLNPDGSSTVLWRTPDGFSMNPAAYAFTPLFEATDWSLLDTEYPPGTRVLFLFGVAGEGTFISDSIFLNVEG